MAGRSVGARGCLHPAGGAPPNSYFTSINKVQLRSARPAEAEAEASGIVKPGRVGCVLAGVAPR